MVVSDRKRTKNPQTQTIRELMDQQGGKITLFSVRGHVGITSNKNADTVAKEALNNIAEQHTQRS
jgi:ribonuclease HI